MEYHFFTITSLWFQLNCFQKEFDQNQNTLNALMYKHYIESVLIVNLLVCVLIIKGRRH